MSGDRGSIASLVASVKQHKKFKALASYSIQCVARAITPPGQGWRDNLKAVVEIGGADAISEVLALHPGDDKIVQAATGALSMIATVPEAAEHLIESGGLKPVLDAILAGNLDTETQLNVAKLLEGLAEKAPAAFVASDGCSAALRLLQQASEGDNIIVAASCSRALEKASRTKEGMEALVKAGCIETVSKAITGISGAVKREADRRAAVSDFSSRRRKSSVRPGRLSTEDAEDAMTPTFRLLERVCRPEANAQRLRSVGGVQALVSALELAPQTKSSDRSKRLGGRLLTRLAGANVGEVVAQLRGSGSDSSAVVSLLSNLALEEDNADAIVQSGGVRALIDSFSASATRESLEKTSRAIGRLATSDSNIETIVRDGGMRALIDALSANSASTAVLTSAAPALVALSRKREHAKAVADGGGVEAVLAAVRTQAADANSVQAGMDFIAAMAASGAADGVLKSQHALQAVAAAVQGPSAGQAARVGGVRALAALSRVCAPAELLEAGGAALAVASLRSRQGQAQTANVADSLAVLAHVAAAKGGERAVVDAGGLELVVASMGRHGASERVRVAVAALSRALGTEARLAAEGKKATQIAARLERADGSVSAEDAAELSKVAGTVGLLAVDRTVARGVVASGAIPGLVSGLEAVAMSMGCPGQEDALQTTAVCLGELASAGPEAQAALVDAGGVQAVVAAIKMHPKLTSSVRASVAVLENLAASKALTAQVVNGRGVEACVTAIRSSPDDPRVCAAASGALLSVCSAGFARTVAQKGATRQMLSTLREHAGEEGYAPCIARAMRVLELCAADEDGRATLIKQKALPAVTAAMGRYVGVGGNEEIVAASGRVLAQLMGRDDVAGLVQNINALARTPAATFGEAGAIEAAAVAMRNVGYLATVGGNAADVVKAGGGQALLALMAHAQALPASEARDKAVGTGLTSLAQVAARTPLGETAALSVPYVMAETAGNNRGPALLCLSALAGDASAARVLMQRSAVPRLLAAVSGERADTNALRAALDTLCVLAARDDLLSQMDPVTVAATVSSFLEDEADDLPAAVAASAAKLLATLASNPAVAASLAEGRTLHACLAAVRAHCVDAAADTTGETATVSMDASPAQVAVFAQCTTALRHLAQASPAGARAVLASGAVRRVARAATGSKAYVRDATGARAGAELVSVLCAEEASADVLRGEGAAASLVQAVAEAQVGSAEVAGLAAIAGRALSGEAEVDEATAFARAVERVRTAVATLRTTGTAVGTAEHAQTVSALGGALRSVAAFAGAEGALTATPVEAVVEVVGEAVEALGKAANVSNTAAATDDTHSGDAATAAAATTAVEVTALRALAAVASVATSSLSSEGATQVAMGSATDAAFGRVVRVVEAAHAGAGDRAGVAEASVSALGAMAGSVGAVRAMASGTGVRLLQATAADARADVSVREAAVKAVGAVTHGVTARMAEYAGDEDGVHAVAATVTANAHDARSLATCVQQLASAHGGAGALAAVLASSVEASQVQATTARVSAMAVSATPVSAGTVGEAAVAGMTAVSASAVGTMHAGSTSVAVAGAAVEASEADAAVAVQTQIVQALATRAAARAIAGEQREVLEQRAVRAVAAVAAGAIQTVTASRGGVGGVEAWRTTSNAVAVLASAELTAETAREVVSGGGMAAVVTAASNANCDESVLAGCAALVAEVARVGSVEDVEALCAAVQSEEGVDGDTVSAEAVTVTVSGHDASQTRAAVACVVASLNRPGVSAQSAGRALSALEAVCGRVGAERAGLDRAAAMTVTRALQAHAGDAVVMAVGGRLVGQLAAHSEDVTALVKGRVEAALSTTSGATAVEGGTGSSVGAVREFKSPDGRTYFQDVATGQTSWSAPPALAAWRESAALVEKHGGACEDMGAEVVAECVRQLGVRRGNDATAGAVGRVLCKLAQRKEVLHQLSGEKEVTAVVGAMRGNPKVGEVQLALARLVNKYAEDAVVKARVAAAGGVEALVAALVTFVEDEKIVTACVSALANLAFGSEDCIAKIFAAEGVPAVEKVMQSYPENPKVLEVAMLVLSNLMYGSDENKVSICQQCGDEMVHVIRIHYRDSKLFLTALRALGNLSFTTANVRFLVVDHHATECIVAGMSEHAGTEALVQTAIDVLGNFAAEPEDEDVPEADSVFGYIHAQGGAVAIATAMRRQGASPALVVAGLNALTSLAEDVKTAHLLVAAGVVETVLDVMQHFDWDESLVNAAMILVYQMTFHPDSLMALTSPDAVTAVLGAADENKDSADVAWNAVAALANIASSNEGRTLIGDQGGVGVLARTLKASANNPDVARYCMEALRQLTGLETLSSQVAETAMHQVFEIIRGHFEDPTVLNVGFALIGQLAFQAENLKALVQHRGIPVIIQSILRHPDQVDLMKQCIKVLDTISITSKEYAAIVIAEGGRRCIQELINAYDDEPEIVRGGQSALLAISVLESAGNEAKLARRGRHKPVIT